MALFTPALPELDYELWRQQTRMDRLKPMVRHWAEMGFGAPDAVYLIYIVKLAAYVLGAGLFLVATPGVGGLGDVSRWFTQPVVIEKVVIWTLLFEVLGLGCGFGPLTLRFVPPIGAFLHWLRPGTIRLPAWPTRVPATRGWTRTWLDVALYIAVLASAVWILLSPATRSSGGLSIHQMIEPWRFVPLLVLLPVLGLRDKTIFLAARAEVYWTTAIMFLLPGSDMIIGAKLATLAIWVGAAASKINKHFPYVVSVMMSNNPFLRVRAIKRRFHRDFPDDIRPSRLSEMMVHGGTVFEFSVPLILFCSHGGIVTNVAAAGMILFHLNILSSLPMGVPLEWNLYMMFAVGYLFVHYASYNPADITGVGPGLVIGAVVVGLVGGIVIGNFAPSKISFLPGMRYYAGNWDTSLWCLTPSAVAKIDAHVRKAATFPRAQLAKLYGEQMADMLSVKGYAFRAMHPHGRALFGLIERACGANHETDYIPVDGEFVAGTTIGWNFGDGHLHNECLIAALHERCDFASGEVRVIILDAQPIHRSSQEYRLVDAATGELERGLVQVRDMVALQPWAGEIPVQVIAAEKVSSKPSHANLGHPPRGSSVSE
ncbi:MAG: DUF3556 domain-containing protein [Actinomycetota bacterium]|nr:DUF3556 domain-containing protein [Actinomycetota bacterium]